MATNPATYTEDPSMEVNLELSSSKRKYQTSNIITQDPSKEGILYFLKANFTVPVESEEQSVPVQNNDQTFRPSQSSSTSNYQ